jgi:1-acyl-sn-glycerol-3-phosphate acyltransferase
MLQRLFRFLYSCYALLVFIVLMLLALPIVLLLAPFGLKGGNAIYFICKCWACSWYFFTGIQHQEIYETPHNYHKQYIFTANHASYLDIPPVVRSIHQPVRVLGKKEMVHYPVFGWIYRTAVIVVDRSSAIKRAQSLRALKAALAKGISIFIFPEGTFNLTQEPLKFFYDGAFKLALETQTPIKPLLFIDSIDRLHHSSIFSLTPGKNRVVFLTEISPKGHTLASLKETVFLHMEQGLRSYRNYTA